jgi:hypothetical protein
MRWLLLLVAACGDNVTSEVPVDAATGCAAAQPVTALGRPALQIHDEQLTLTVLSHDEHGALCTRTSATGDSAMVDIAAPPNGMVTMVIESDFTRSAAFTWTGVQPGDHLVFPTQLFRDQTGVPYAVEMTIPTVAGASSYQVVYACDDGVVSLAETTPAPGVFDDMAVCSAHATKLATTVIATQPSGAASYAIGNLTPLAAGTTAIALSAPGGEALPITIHGGLDGDGAIAFAGWIPARGYGGFDLLANATFDATGTATTTIDVPATGPLVASAFVNTQAISRGIANRLFASLPAAIEIQSTELLPAIEPTFDMGGPSTVVTWGVTAIDADIALINVGNWGLAADANARIIQFPPLPAGTFQPDTSGNGLLIVDQIDAVTYDDVRQDPAGVLAGPEYRMTRSGASQVFHDP